MGCGCGSKMAGNGGAASHKVTVFEVEVNGSTVSEFGSLPEARAKAIEVGGRVRVGTRVVSG